MPSVAALQIMLNRALPPQHRVVVDGFFGPATEAAVRFYQGRLGVQQNGICGRHVWSALIARENVQVVDHVDIHDGDLLLAETRYIEYNGGRVHTPLFAGESLSHVLDRLQTRCMEKPVVLLRFFGHGAPGGLEVSGYDGFLQSGEAATGCGGGDLTPSAPFSGREYDYFFSAIRPYMAPFGSIEFHGCNTGMSREGRNFLRGVVNRAEAPASAGVQTQYSTTWVRSIDNVRFEGWVRTYYPGGNARTWIARTPDAIENAIP